MQIAERLPESKHQRQEETQWIQCCCNVVPKELRISEGVSSHCAVIEVPESQRHSRNQECKHAPSSCDGSFEFAAGACHLPFDRWLPADHFPSHESQRGNDGGFFGKCRKREPHRGGLPSAFDVRQQSPENECRGGEIHLH